MRSCLRGSDHWGGECVFILIINPVGGLAKYALATHHFLLPPTTSKTRQWHLGQREEYLPTSRGFDGYVTVHTGLPT